ncbi:MAG: TRAP transporter small permease subunit [Rhodobacteraceae bacterium]|nr:TRAP transporter small permease subunit [Paracoccaceae bacterium]
MTIRSVRATGHLRAIDAATGKLSLSLSVVASFTILLFMFLVTTDVVMRNLGFRPINGVTDFVAHAVGACVFLQLGSTIRERRLINADFLMGDWVARKPVLANGANALFYAAGAAILVVAALWLGNDFRKAWTTNEFTGAVGAYQIRLWPFKFAVAFGAGFAAFEAARIATVHALRAWREAVAGGLRAGGAWALAFWSR